MNSPISTEISSREIPTDNLHAVVVTYNPDDRFCERLHLLSNQFHKTWIVNNGGKLDLLPTDFCASLGTIEVIEMGHNAGIAKAMNTGVAAATESGSEWVALFDQDSQCPKEFVALSSEAIQWASNQPMIGMFATAFSDNGKIYQQPPKRSGALYPEIMEAITSGSVVRTSVFMHLSGYDESFFIDFVDHDYLMRMNRAGYRACLIALEMIHHIGNGKVHNFFGIRFVTTNHSPGRLYASGHNLVKMLRRHGRCLPLRMGRLTFREATRLIRIMLFENSRLIKLERWFTGARRALLNSNSIVTETDLIGR